MFPKKDNLKIVACSPPRCKCPVMDINFENHEIVIIDDYGGKVKMTFTEMSILSQRFLEHV